MVYDTSITAAIHHFVQNSSVAAPLNLLRRHLPREAVVYIVGGALRNLVIEHLQGASPETKDIDIFIGGITPDYSFDELLRDQTWEKTDLGGIRWRPDGCPYAIDFCALAGFAFFEKYHLSPTLHNLLSCIDFNVNAIVFDINAMTLHEQECTAAVKERLIDFNTTRLLNRLLLAYRILLIRHKTGFLLSAPVFQYVKDQIDLNTLRALKGLLNKKTGKATAKAVMADYDAICSFQDYAAYTSQYRLSTS